MLTAFAATAAAQAYAKDVRPVLVKYCWDCPADGEKRATWCWMPIPS